MVSARNGILATLWLQASCTGLLHAPNQASGVSDGGSTSTSSLAIYEVAPLSLSYSHMNPYYGVGTAIFANYPSVVGGQATGFTVSPALPSGLSIHTTTGVISGTPTDRIATTRLRPVSLAR